MSTVAFLGLGAMGRPMAARLAAAPGITLAVWNRTAERARAFAQETGVRHAPTPADAARGADVVLTCFPASPDGEAVLDGANGLLAGLARGGSLVDCTSGDPTTSRRIAARLAEHGIGFLDAPVSGGTIGAEQGTLTVMVGGESALLARARPVLETFCKKIVNCGDVGAGAALYAVHNALLVIHDWSTSDGHEKLTSS